MKYSTPFLKGTVSSVVAIKALWCALLRAYPWRSVENGHKTYNTIVSEIQSGEKLLWGDGNSWVTDTFAAAFSNLRINPIQYEEAKAYFFKGTEKDS